MCMSSAANEFPPLKLASAILRHPLTADQKTPLPIILAQMRAAAAGGDIHAQGQCPLEGPHSPLCATNRARCVIVVDQNRVMGILTQSDLLRLSYGTDNSQGRAEPQTFQIQRWAR